MKQETPEEVKKKSEFIHSPFRNSDFDLEFKFGGLIGTKWRQERSSVISPPVFIK
jgi:hypothetical protein